MHNYITTDWLNLRTEPVVKKGNVLCILPPDTLIEEVENGSTNDWLKVKVIWSKTVMEGFAATAFLQETDASLPEPDDTTLTIAEAHLKVNRVVERGSTQSRAYPLNEPTLKKVKLSELTSEDRKLAIHGMLNFLDVEHSVRYAPTASSTYCNIYAADLAYCLGVYIPRVWWTTGALAKILEGKTVDVVYEKTVTELNANSLANWFESHGPLFKWNRISSITDLQNEVNKGSLGIIVAQRIDLNRSGHIVAVVPENETNKANRTGNIVLSPLQSQAGSKNKKYFTDSNWWEQEGKFRKFSFWVWGG